MEEREFRILSHIIKNTENMKKGTSKEIDCVDCDGKLIITKNSYNGHVWAKCNKCKFTMIQ